MMPNFWQFTTTLILKIQSFHLWFDYSWFLAKNLSNFVSLPWKLHNRYCHKVGKIFSIVGAFQAFLPFASSPLFGFLYRATVATFPAAFLFLVAALKLVEGKNKSIIGLILNGPVKSNQKMAVFRSHLETWGVVPIGLTQT